MSEPQVVERIQAPFQLRLGLPGSKSITLRDCLLAALAEGRSYVNRPGECDDYWRMKDSLKRLGLSVAELADGVSIDGNGGRFQPGHAELFLNQSATSTRLLLAACALRPYPTVIDGDESMRARPNKYLLDALSELGASVRSTRDGHLPVEMTGSTTLGSEVSLRGDVSSQFFTGLLVIAPLLSNGLTIQVEGDLVSKPYVGITLNEMRKFGVEVENRNFEQLIVAPGQYRATTLTVEGDASGASYFAALATLHSSEVVFENLGRSSCQGDYQFFKICEALGARVERSYETTTIRGPETLTPLRGDVDMESMPDVAPTLMMIAPFLPGTTRLTGLGTLRVKECDRISAPATELKKLGVQLREGPDFIEIDELPEHAPVRKGEVAIETYEDHRIAMCFGVLGTKLGGLCIQNPECVGKTYPEYWADLARCYG